MAAVVEEVVFVVVMTEEVVVAVVSEVEVVAEAAAVVVVDFEVAEDVATDIKKRICFPFCLLFAIFCMAILIIVVVFSIRYIHKTNNMKQKYTKKKENVFLIIF